MNKATKRQPPPKQPDTCKGPRRFNGSLWDVATCAVHLGITEKTLRARVRRNLVPFRRYSGRVLFIAKEIEQFCDGLDGVTPAEALRNLAARGRRG